MLYKTCPRCTGDLYVERGSGYAELVCLQCGFRQGAEARQRASSDARRERERGRRVAA